jgi:pilus assembly protein CpaF
VREEALAILREERHILPRSVLTKVINEVSVGSSGLGPIEFLLKDPEVTEVTVNGPDDVYVERKGRGLLRGPRTEFGYPLGTEALSSTTL